MGDNNKITPKNFEDFVKAVQYALSSGVLMEHWKTATEVHAIHIQLHEPEHDGSFEVVFVAPEHLQSRLALFSKHGKVDVLSFEAGIALAKDPGCVGGAHTLMEAEQICALNPALTPAPSRLG